MTVFRLCTAALVTTRLDPYPLFRNILDICSHLTIRVVVIVLTLEAVSMR
jgi:hypothetical protein